MKICKLLKNKKLRGSKGCKRMKKNTNFKEIWVDKKAKIYRVNFMEIIKNKGVKAQILFKTNIH